jgi:Fe-S cluster biogenesis protein NfuA/nitrite reductase/ring-hydroxylating ferredoxin subunit
MAEAAPALDDRAARERVARVDVLLEELERAGPAIPTDLAVELVQALLDLYGEGLSRVVAEVAARDGDGAVAAALAGDELVSHLLLLHGLHPLPLESRVRGALDEVRPYLESHGGDVELLGVADGVVRLALRGSCDGCASSAATLKLAIEDAIHKAAPDVEAVEAEGAAPPPPAPLLQLEISDALRAPPTGAWADAGTLDEAGDGAPRVREVAGEPVLFAALNSTRFAYRPACPGCAGSLDGAALRDDELECPGCGRRYDVRRAGRCVSDPALHLEPVPLLVDAAGTVKVALGAPV